MTMTRILCSFAYVATLLLQVASAQNESGTARLDGARRIIIQAGNDPVDPPLFYRSSAKAKVSVRADRIDQVIQIQIKVVQGKAKTMTFGLNGAGDVKAVRGEKIVSWAIRQKDSERFLDIQVAEDAQEILASVELQTLLGKLPVQVELTHLTPGKSIGFDSLVEIRYSANVVGNMLAADGFVPLASQGTQNRYQSATGGQLLLNVNRKDASRGPIELADVTLVGEMNAGGNSVEFKLKGVAQVSEADAKLSVLSGNVAVSQVPASEHYQLQLTQRGGEPVYELRFPKAGSYPIEIDFVAALHSLDASWQGMDFTIATSAVVPITLRRFESELEFHRAQDTVVPILDSEQWVGFLPATGHVKILWKNARSTSAGKLFFMTSARIDTTVGPGLLRQSHLIEYQVLQGELSSIDILLRGPGEILNVEGENIVAWKVEDGKAERTLSVMLSQPIDGTNKILVISQTPVDAFPVRVEALRLKPVGAIRHSGHVRIRNSGSVRLEPTDLEGLTQLSPEQFPGPQAESRQTFVYRFPAADHAFTISADRIQPEVNISELVVYQLSESDRAIVADIELDIREAAVREWDFGVPEDYSIVSVSGSALADYIAASEVDEGTRNLKVIFGQEVIGRQLISMHLEKNEVAAAGDWVLPRIRHPGAKSVRGDLGVVAAPGFRIASGQTDLLVEKPLSYFPNQLPNLQQAFRVREPGWSATMQIEPLQRSIQSDGFHLYSLSQGTVYGSALINYFVTGAPTFEWRLNVPAELGNVMVDGQDIRTWRREGETLIVSLHQPVMGPYTLLITFEQKPNELTSSFQAGVIAPIDVQGDRGYVQVVSPMQVELESLLVSNELLVLDALELPAEFRLLSTAPALGTWQYTERPFDLRLKVNWFQPGTTAKQVVEFSEANSRVSPDGELVTDVVYYVKSRGRQALRVQLPGDPVRLWAVTVNGQPVTARQADNATLIPLPGGADSNIPVEVRLRLGKPAVDENVPELALPTVFAPVLKTQWNVAGDENHVLVPSGGSVDSATPVLRPTGFEWVARLGLVPLGVFALLVVVGGPAISRNNNLMFGVGLVCLVLAVISSSRTAWEAFEDVGAPVPLKLSLPVLASGESVGLQVQNLPSWLVNFSWVGIGLLAGGLLVLVWSLTIRNWFNKRLLRVVGFGLAGTGILMQGNGAPWFFVYLAAVAFFLLLVPAAWIWIHGMTVWIGTWAERRAQRRQTAGAEQQATDGTGSGASGVATTVLAIVIGSASLAGNTAVGDEETNAKVTSLKAASRLVQNWDISKQTSRLVGKGTIQITGYPGDQFVLLRAPAVLTKFEGEGLRLTKDEQSENGLVYVLTIPLPEENPVEGKEAELDSDVIEDTETKDNVLDIQRDRPAVAESYAATFEFLLEAVNPTQGILVLTGAAAVQELELNHDEVGWDVTCASAARLEVVEDASKTSAKLLLGPGSATVVFRPRARDISQEDVQFFVEGANLYLPGPGVVDGVHRLRIRTAQGRVRELSVIVPEGLTVSAVGGPVSSWQFDADVRRLMLEIDASVDANFDVVIETQRGLAPLPADVGLGPMRVEEAGGEVGLMAVAFGPDAQPEKIQAEGLSLVNLGDFDAVLLEKKEAVLHRVYRYGAAGGSLQVRVAPVAAEVRVVSRQVLSLGDERVVLAVNFAAEITRAGLFQLSFPLPDGLEVESLSGDALDHWTELSQDGQRTIVLRLKGKTIGTHKFSLTLAGAAPTATGDWNTPRFQLNEADRQTGDLVVRPITGIRLRTVTRQNVSEADPREMGGQGQGALAFRLLQKDWDLLLGIEKLDPWVTGQVLHQVTLREGQTRSMLVADFHVQNASIRTLQVTLPITDEDESKTLRASGKTISDIVRTADDSNTWEIQFKRRVIGRIQFQIEYERRGDRANANETLSPVQIPEARQLAYYFGVRAGGRLELEPGPLTQGWQLADWNTVPQNLRAAGDRTAPALALRAMAPPTPLSIRAIRHSLAEALKLRVAEGTLTSILSPTGDQLTAVDVTMEVIQRSSLSVQLPEGGELFNIFVNGESVHSIRQSDSTNAWQFYILPGIDDRTAKVRFVYSLTGDGLEDLKLTSPQLNVPLENVRWNVIAPDGYELADHDGNLELVDQESREGYDRSSYLSKVNGKRKVQAQQAAKLLEQANQLLQAGQQAKARWALNSVANRYALDAASNEDARVQLENLQTQQAVVGLNTRRQRLYLDNNRSNGSVTINEQLKQAASINPILQQDQLNFRPQELSQLLGGNTTEDNAVLQQIAGRLVQHQRTTEPAPQAIIISIPEEGTAYGFSRSVQVAENAPLELELQFRSSHKLQAWQLILIGSVLLALAASLAVVPRHASSNESVGS